MRTTGGDKFYVFAQNQRGDKIFGNVIDNFNGKPFFLFTTNNKRFYYY